MERAESQHSKPTHKTCLIKMGRIYSLYGNSPPSPIWLRVYTHTENSGYGGDCFLSGTCHQQIWAIKISVIGQNNLYSWPRAGTTHASARVSHRVELLIRNYNLSPQPPNLFVKSPEPGTNTEVFKLQSRSTVGKSLLKELQPGMETGTSQ